MTTTSTKAPEATSFKTLPVAQIKVHPKNPRHRATADDELVASLKEHGLVQPLIVVPTATDYLLIAGHRRLAGLKKARIKEAPVVVRHDLNTDAKQLEAMLIENSSRQDLTPIEEAEGYEQLTLLGYKQTKIATLTGRSPKTISTRLRLLKLQKSTQDRIHKGQLTIDDAAAMIAFADDPETTKKLERAAASGNSWSFRSALDGAKRKKKTAVVAAEHLALCTAGGLAEISNPEGHETWSFPGHKSLARLENVKDVQKEIADEKKQHKSCLGYLIEDNSYSGRQVILMCTNTTGHKDQDSDQYQADEAKRAADTAARVQHQADAELAQRIRFETVLNTVAAAKTLPDVLADITRGLLPSLIRTLSGDHGARPAYQDFMGIPTDARWGYLYGGGRQDDLFQAHVDEINAWSNTQVTRALFVALTTFADDGLRHVHGGGGTPALAYVDLLEALGHERSPVDQELVDELHPPAQAGAA